MALYKPWMEALVAEPWMGHWLLKPGLQAPFFESFKALPAIALARHKQRDEAWDRKKHSDPALQPLAGAFLIAKVPFCLNSECAAAASHSQPSLL